MKNAVLYILTVLIWGSTWLAIEFQLGEVHVITSVAYRFAIAAVIMWLFCWWRGIPLRYSARNHGFMFLLALFNFSLNYAIIYSSQVYLSSAMTSVAFSTMLMMNIVNTRLFFGSKISPRVYIGAVFGIGGILTLFWEDLHLHQSDNQLIGLSLVLLAALSTSSAPALGDAISTCNSVGWLSTSTMRSSCGIASGDAAGVSVMATGMRLRCKRRRVSDPWTLLTSQGYFWGLDA